MSAEEERLLIHRLAVGELDDLEAKRARSLVARNPELAALLAELEELQARVRAAFPEPPPAREKRAFVAMMERLTVTAPDNGEAAPARRQLGSRAADVHQLRSASMELSEPPMARYRKPPRVPSAIGAPGAEAGAHLFHLREIPREDGLSVELELFAGDLLALHSEVLILSAFVGGYHPTPGSLFGAIAQRFGISFEHGRPRGTQRHPGGLLHFRGVSCPAFDSLWVLEMTKVGEEFSRADLRAALASIERALPEMLSAASSITLPLLGTGNQGLDPREVAREILSAIPRWAATPQLRTVRVVTHSLAHVAILNRALDEREFGVANSALILACAELQERLERGDWRDPVRGALKDLLAIASASEPSLPSIALEGRRVAEVLMQQLVREASEEPEALTAALREEPARRPDRVTRYLELLLDQGRAAAAGEPIAANDAVMVLHAAMQAARDAAR